MFHARRAICCLLVLTLCAAVNSAFAAPDKRPSISKKHTRSHASAPRKSVRPQSCSEFGAGFVRMPGSDSCIRFGGGVGMGVGAVP
jgi:hypothetical protein